MTTLRSGPTVERRELAARAQALRDEGKLQREVAEILGLSRSYAAELTSDPLGVKARERKDSYHGVCEGCGAATTGSDGREAAPSLCWDCSHGRQTAERKWSRENVIDAIQRFAAANGRPPTATEWIRGDPANGYPPRSAVYRSTGHRSNSSAPFAKWADAIEAAGFPRPRTGHYQRPAKARPRRQTRHLGRSMNMRDFVVLEQQDNGQWVAHQGVNAYNEGLAVEAYVESLGAANGKTSHRFVAVPAHRWIIRELQPVTSYKAVAVEAVKA